MKSTFASIAFSAGLALAVSGCAAGADGPAEGSHGTQGTQGIGPQQQRIASTTYALEKAYDEQYVNGRVDPAALQPMIYDVLQSMPEQSREQAQAHIYDVISNGQKDAQETSPDQRAQTAAPVSGDKLGPQQVDLISAWGWGPYAGLGYGGYGMSPYYGGAYGYGYGAPYYGGGAYGYGAPYYGAGYGAAGYGYGAAYGAAYGTGCGWGWGGLGAFGWPAYGAAYGVGVPGGWGW